MKKINHNFEENEIKVSKYDNSYIKLANNRIIFLNEVFTKKVAAELTALLLYYDHVNSKEDIILYINSPGGDADGLIQIYDVMQMIKAPVKTICLGKACSAGAVILAAGAKGKRYAMKHSEIMIHGIQFSFPLLGEDIISSKNYYEYVADSNHTVMKILSNHTGYSLDKITEDCKRDVWLNAEESCSYGLVDKIL